jgi:hypothetical protein
VARFEELPSPTGADAREQYVLDFKETVDPANWWELAKDVAAFANAIGGVILVGVKEGPPPVYEGLPRDIAERIQVAYENSTKEHLSPRPIVDPVLVSTPSGNFIVAVNVNPYADQPIGSRLPRANRNGDLVPYDAWQFPVRVGRDTRPLEPAMIPMLTNPRVRRAVILLEAIPKPGAPSFQEPRLLWRHPTNRTKAEPQQTAVRIEAVEPEKNAVALRVMERGGNTTIRVPLDDVEAVWEARDHVWHIRVSGSVGGQGTPEYVSNPASAAF